ncbi:hypothetical protein BV20DRAFT_1036841 [Pilatotrama ljubarskyi]|nr:hypothetical protein BV20DRAFT_1036841 [Pilatotrama ljubarskyi]
MSPRPHPILKRDSSPFRTPTLPFSTCGPLFSPHVHFPPTPRLVAATYPAHSPTTYDRAPIAVSPNVCQLPRRGERTNIKGSYFHPRAYEACKPEPLNVPSATFDLPSTPPLVQDLSPSDESDDVTATTPPDSNLSSSISSPIALHFAPAPRCSPDAERADVDSPPPISRSSPRSKPGAKARRPTLTRKETRLGGRSLSFSPDMDEGCLGGF